MKLSSGEVEVQVAFYFYSNYILALKTIKAVIICEDHLVEHGPYFRQKFKIQLNKPNGCFVEGTWAMLISRLAWKKTPSLRCL